MPRSNEPPFVRVRSFLPRVLLAVVSILGTSQVSGPAARGQRASGAVNVGLQVGRPGGVTVKLYRPNHTAYSGLLTTDGDDLLTLSAHRLWEQSLPNSLLYGYVGPGTRLGLRVTGGTRRPDFAASVQAGLNFHADRFEVFLHVTPRLRLLPSIDPKLGGGVGLRYRLRRP